MYWFATGKAGECPISEDAKFAQKNSTLTHVDNLLNSLTSGLHEATKHLLIPKVLERFPFSLGIFPQPLRF